MFYLFFNEHEDEGCWNDNDEGWDDVGFMYGLYIGERGLFEYDENGLVEWLEDVRFGMGLLVLVLRIFVFFLLLLLLLIVLIVLLLLFI
jgi:hypothetical protein